MKMTIEEYFNPNMTASFINAQGKRQLVSAKSSTRIKEAKQQYKKAPIEINLVISYVNEFLDLISDKTKKSDFLKSIRLGGINHPIINRAIIVNDCDWDKPIYDDEKNRYTYWDSKYDIIKNVFNLKYPSDVVWMKFTEDGYLGVVADSFDINFRYENSSGTLIRVNDKEKKWNESCVVIFPITEDLLMYKTRKEIETGVGNYLESKGVPVIDYFSHNNF